MPRSLLTLLLASLLLPLQLHARWNSEEDDRSQAKLESMSSRQLFDEAFDVCIRRALLEGLEGGSEGLAFSVANAASDYLDVIAAVVSAKSGGDSPVWMDLLLAARTTKECQRGFRAFVAAKPEEPRQVRQEVQAEGPARENPVRASESEEAALAPRRPGPSNQLPPWLAPR